MGSAQSTQIQSPQTTYLESGGKCHGVLVTLGDPNTIKNQIPNHSDTHYDNSFASDDEGNVME